jgi:hypothetical protein
MSASKGQKKTSSVKKQSTKKSSEAKASEDRRDRKGSPGFKEIELQLKEYERSATSNSAVSKSRKSADKSKALSKTNSVKKGRKIGAETLTNPKYSEETPKTSQKYVEKERNNAVDHKKSKEMSKKRTNFTKKSKPEIISGPEIIKTRSTKSVKAQIAPQKSSFLDTIYAVCSDRNLAKVMHNQNIDPTRLHQTLQRTSAKYESLMKDYLRFSEERNAWEASLASDASSGPYARSIYAFEAKMHQKFLMEKQAHEKRIRDLVSKFDRIR